MSISKFIVWFFVSVLVPVLLPLVLLFVLRRLREKNAEPSLLRNAFAGGALCWTSLALCANVMFEIIDVLSFRSHPEFLVGQIFGIIVCVLLMLLSSVVAIAAAEDSEARASGEKVYSASRILILSEWLYLFSAIVYGFSHYFLGA